MSAAAFAALATDLGGFLHHGEVDRAWTPAGLLFIGFGGMVKLDHHGHIHRLGHLTDGTDAIAAKVRELTGATV